MVTGRDQGKVPHDPVTIGSDAEHSLSVQVLSGVDAATAQKGHIKLAGELTGTAALPTIVTIHSGSAHHTAITLGAGAAELTLVGQQLTLAEVLTPAEHTTIGDSSPHHVRYADSEAVSAMGVKGDSNPLNHDRYTNAEALAAVFNTAAILGTL